MLVHHVYISVQQARRENNIAQVSRILIRKITLILDFNRR